MFATQNFSGCHFLYYTFFIGGYQINKIIYNNLHPVETSIYRVSDFRIKTFLFRKNQEPFSSIIPPHPDPLPAGEGTFLCLRIIEIWYE